MWEGEGNVIEVGVWCGLQCERCGCRSCAVIGIFKNDVSSGRCPRPTSDIRLTLLYRTHHVLRYLEHFSVYATPKRNHPTPCYDSHKIISYPYTPLPTLPPLPPTLKVNSPIYPAHSSPDSHQPHSAWQTRSPNQTAVLAVARALLLRTPWPVNSVI